MSGSTIMDAFRNLTGLGGNPAPKTQEANPTVPSGTTPKSDGSVIAIPAAATGDKSPLAGFVDLWNTSNDPKHKDYVKPAATTAVSFKIDPAAIMKTAQEVDFTKVLSPELQDRINKGDPKAFMEGLNVVAQAAFAQSSGAATMMLNSALAEQAKKFRTEVLPDVLRNNAISTQLRADNPIFDNPAVLPLLKSVEFQMARKNPNDTPFEVSAKAKEYLTGFASEFLTASGKVITDKPAEDVSKKSGSREPQNWGEYFGVDTAVTS